MNKKDLSTYSFALQEETVEELKKVKEDKRMTWDEVFQYLLNKEERK